MKGHKKKLSQLLDLEIQVKTFLRNATSVKINKKIVMKARRLKVPGTEFATYKNNESMRGFTHEKDLNHAQKEARVV